MATITMTSKEKQFKAIWAEALVRGLEAGKRANPEPMTVVMQASGETKRFYEPEGLCGFAWVNIRPGTSSFARWLKSKGVAETDWTYGGVSYHVREHNQSIERKEAHAEAIADTLKEHGIDAIAMSRLD